MGYGISVLVSGEYALFTRPEMKAERVSYDVITPSAARGILESIYWHPGLSWRIDRITVLNEIIFDSIRRNELGSKIPFGNVKKAMNGKEVDLHQYIKDDRQQRASLLLRDVAYIIDAHFDVFPDRVEKSGDEEPIKTKRADKNYSKAAEKELLSKKFYNIFLRRMRKGQHYHQAYLGCREFPAHVKLIEGDEECPAGYYAEEEHRDLGWMLWDIEYSEHPQSFTPRFFRAEMRRGVIDVRSEVNP
jgi:CRISPR-associated protein Cas5 subtype I-C